MGTVNRLSRDGLQLDNQIRLTFLNKRRKWTPT
jgi:hypothetical protein